MTAITALVRLGSAVLAAPHLPGDVTLPPGPEITLTPGQTLPGGIVVPTDVAPVQPLGPGGLGPDVGGVLDGAPTGFLVVGAVVALGFVLVLGTIALRAVRYAAASPESAEATCVTKRAHVSGGDHSTHTSYHVTVERADGSRRELRCPARLYGLVREGDRGVATWRSDVLTGFDRHGAPPAPGARPA